jgi:lactate dehydrogenase-like 2-hydroxyacid dehydrogenase
VELTWALILGLARRIPVEDAAVRAGSWQTTVGTDLAGRTLGIAGLGRIGSRVARVGAAFGMRVVAWSQNLDPERARSKGVLPVSKLELLTESDVLTIHLVLSDRTRGLFGPPDLAAMRADAILVNTSRGPIVDEDALAEALRAGRLGGAALDVFGTEPLPADHPLRSGHQRAVRSLLPRGRGRHRGLPRRLPHTGDRSLTQYAFGSAWTAGGTGWRYNSEAFCQVMRRMSAGGRSPISRRMASWVSGQVESQCG